MTVTDCPETETPTASWRDKIIGDVQQLVKLETWREQDRTNEKQVRENLLAIRKIFHCKTQEFNKQHPKLTIDEFDWSDNDNNEKWDKYRVFGYRACGSQVQPDGKTRKTSLICHLDTVPPGNNDWKPFDARVETRIYKGVPTDFLIGRGTIDDKGPAVVAFDAFLQALHEADAQGGLTAGVTLEVLFDTSEETDMSTPHYLETLTDAEKPDMGVVFDAFWAVRAEKGIERPVFKIKRSDVPTDVSQASQDATDEGRLSILSLKTSEGSGNMIPVYAQAQIAGDREALSIFAQRVAGWYRTCPFDDPHYHPADLQIIPSNDNGNVVLKTLVAGAQHGSAPDQNRANGANPLVSLTNFLACLIERRYLADNVYLANNVYGEMSRFIRWAFGTRAFGENHPDLLSRYDPVFQEGNGTTYALTQLQTKDEDDSVELWVDIRYALGHHGQGWNGSEGVLQDDSLFTGIFADLVASWSDVGGASVTCETTTVFGPDIRSPRNENLSRVAIAYRAVMGENCPMRAIGGGTDAHGDLHLVTAGALFTDDMGPPINYHGLDEGAPLIDLENSSKILLYLLRQETGANSTTVAEQLGHHGNCCLR